MDSLFFGCVLLCCCTFSFSLSPSYNALLYYARDEEQQSVLGVDCNRSTDDIIIICNKKFSYVVTTIIRNAVVVVECVSKQQSNVRSSYYARTIK
jgi:hypothetical protein